MGYFWRVDRGIRLHILNTACMDYWLYSHGNKVPGRFCFPCLYRSNHYQIKLSKLTPTKLERGATKHLADVWKVRNPTQKGSKLTEIRMVIYHLGLTRTFACFLGPGKQKNTPSQLQNLRIEAGESEDHSPRYKEAKIMLYLSLFFIEQDRQKACY